jgi:hypothetical protein
MPDYQHMTRDELLNLAQERDQLTDEACVALDSEISKRQIGATEIVGYARESLAQVKAAERRINRSRIVYETRNKSFIGKRNRKLDPRRRVEEFDTTLWFVLLIPVFPMGSYRIRRRLRRWWSPCRSMRLHILDTRPRDWEQILVTWVKTATILFALSLALFAVRTLHW